MSKTRYQMIPESESPQMIEVNLVADTQPISTTIAETSSNDNEISIATNSSNIGEAPRLNTVANIDVNPAPTCELPSYSEALKLKKQEVKLDNNEIPPSYYSSINPSHVDETRIIIDPAELRAIAEASESTLTDQEIGSECMFLTAFMIAFFFNWVGFFASICLLPNAAGKYGALSGFGLSMAKWVTIYQSWMTQMNDFQQKLFFWLFIFIGFYLFFRGLVNFMNLKYRPRANAAYNQRLRERWFGFVE